ncbi:MAG: HAMP domain-containing histidine kinase, partial [Bacilli bacterium]|nr:HAMP domain-containing histidine kinase [Bacilli bacterium]
KKKLKTKTFLSILIILTFFQVTVLFIFNYQNYQDTKENILQNINRMYPEMPNNEKLENKDNFTEGHIETEEPKRFIDATIYTIKLDQNNNIINIISHTMAGEVNTNIKQIANNIIATKGQNTLHIGNLYFEKYSYNYKEDTIIIIDNTKETQKLLSSLQTSIILFILLEIIIIVISNIISKWITKPVIESFNKQKQFIADASHELKTPLAVIMASSESINETKTNQKYLNNIKLESERMNSLIKNLLTLAKTENIKTEIGAEINLSKVVEKQTSTMESLMYEKNIKLTENINKDIFYKIKEEDIKQVLTILLDNAIKHSLEKGHITVNLYQEKSNIIIEVINEGLPIPKGEEEKIFERFYRSDKSRNRNENRYGLGLAIAKNIITNYKGTIIAFSKDNYTTFKINLKK